MSGLAYFLKECGNSVSGSDIAESEQIYFLKKQGINLSLSSMNGMRSSIKILFQRKTGGIILNSSGIC